MPATQQEPQFTTEEAQRFAALMAGFEIGNSSEAEAVGKGGMMRRMLSAKGLRIVDALELPEIRQAIDDQLQPVRTTVTDSAALHAELEDLRGKLAFVVPKLREVTERLTNERKELVEAAMLVAGQCVVGLFVQWKFGIVESLAAQVVWLLMLVVFCED
jgi:hypothetical protein